MCTIVDGIYCRGGIRDCIEPIMGGTYCGHNVEEGVCIEPVSRDSSFTTMHQRVDLKSLHMKIKAHQFTITHPHKPPFRLVQDQCKFSKPPKCRDHYSVGKDRPA